MSCTKPQVTGRKFNHEADVARASATSTSLTQDTEDDAVRKGSVKSRINGTKWRWK